MRAANFCVRSSRRLPCFLGMEDVDVDELLEAAGDGKAAGDGEVACDGGSDTRSSCWPLILGDTFFSVVPARICARRSARDDGEGGDTRSSE